MRARAGKIATIGVAGILLWSGVAAGQTVATTRHFSFYDRDSGLVYTLADGQVADLEGPPAPGSQIEFTDLDYAGDMAHHVSAWAASDHFVCVFDAHDNPTCNGQVAINGSMLIVKGAGGQGDFAIPVVAGTGSFLGFTGTLKIADISDTINANIELSVSKA
jgi:hypothetical protein